MQSDYLTLSTKGLHSRSGGRRTSDGRGGKSSLRTAAAYGGAEVPFRPECLLLRRPQSGRPSAPSEYSDDVVRSAAANRRFVRTSSRSERRHLTAGLRLRLRENDRAVTGDGEFHAVAAAGEP